MKDHSKKQVLHRVNIDDKKMKIFMFKNEYKEYLVMFLELLRFLNCTLRCRNHHTQILECLDKQSDLYVTYTR